MHPYSDNMAIGLLHSATLRYYTFIPPFCCIISLLQLESSKHVCGKNSWTFTRKFKTEAELHVARFLEKKLNSKILTSKNSKNNHGCREYRDPQLWKFVITNSLCSDLGEKDKSGKILRLRTVHRFRSAHFSFLPRSEYNEFVFEIFHIDVSQYCLQPRFFSEFFEVKICGFNFFWKPSYM